MNVRPLTDDTYRGVVFSSREPVLVAFMAEADSSCRALRPILTDLARERAGRLNVASVDVATNPSLTHAWGITQIPTMLLFHRGTLQRVLRGVRPAARLAQEIDEMPISQVRYAALLDGGSDRQAS